MFIIKIIHVMYNHCIKFIKMYVKVKDYKR